MRCEQCGTPVEAECASRAWCSEECREAWLDAHRAEWEADGWIAVVDASPSALMELEQILSTPVLH